MKATLCKLPLPFLLVVTCASAEAHTFGANGAGFAEGLLHPLLGMDHLLAMVAVGIWAGQRGGAALWLAPLSFLTLMAGAALLGSIGIEVRMLEPAIAGSVLALGLLIALAVRPSLPTSVALVGLFAAFHGYAHGVELPETASAAAYGAGFLSATALLHGLGVALALFSRRHALTTRMSGAAIAAAGLWLLAGA